jgi:alkylhydroperoxidase family enzyme
MNIQMLTYQIHNIVSAPEKSKPLLELFTEAIGFVPNLAGAIANSPVLAKSLLGVFQNVHSGSFTEAEVQVLLLTNAVTNSSSWPVAFHTAIALKQGLDPADVQAIRERRLPKQQRYAALSRLAKTLIENRGQVSDDELDRFLRAGFEKEHVLEVVGVTAASTITNYAGKITNPPLEAFLEEHAWRG